jgi:tetrahydromethanopterin S-methyltransferase subunit B
LFGYVTNATNGFDNGLMVRVLMEMIYSIKYKNLTIQGRVLPFDKK